MRWLLVGSVVIVLYDVVLAVGSGWFAYEYGAWWPGLVGSGAILATSAFMAARDRGTRSAGTVAGVGVAVVDVLVGWPVSGAIIPGYFPGGTVAEVGQTLVLVALAGGALGAIIGFIAGTLGARRGKARITAPG